MLKTAYPGLLIGLGNPHQSNANNIDKSKGSAEIKLGFTLDYVTGLPVIPGSTVKGVLRSAFRNYPNAIDPMLLAEMKTIFGSDGTDQDFQRGQCVFFDALPVAADKNHRLFEMENITPHQPDLLKNPIPLTLLKVLPEVTYLFRFRLAGCPYADRFLVLFQEILLNLGIGAKTNVGFGKLQPAKGFSEYHMLLRSASINSTGSVAPPRNICQEPGCEERTAINKRSNIHHPYCKKHFEQHNTKKGGKKS